MSRSILRSTASLFVTLGSLGLIACSASTNGAIFQDTSGGGGGTDAGSTGGGGQDGSVTVSDGGGGSDGSTVTTSPSGDTGVTTTPTGGTDASPTETGPVTPTLDTVCATLADGLCRPSLKNCCDSKSVTWDEAGCRNKVTNDCNAAVDAVKNMGAAFDPTQVDACIRAWAALTTSCTPSWYVFDTSYGPCQHIFPGTGAPGDNCSQDSDCQPSDNGVAACKDDGMGGTHCVRLTIVDRGATCDAGSLGVIGSRGTTDIHLCKQGDYCQDTTSSGSGTCVAGQRTGASCTGATDPSCGLGKGCIANKCGDPGASGAACSSGLQCQSDVCQPSMMGGGGCSDPAVTIATAAACSGG
jgi:hypothetical protein